MGQMKTFRELREAREKVAVFTFGRFNPPTTGHEKLIEKLASVAKQNSANYFVYPSHSQNPKKDPLPHAKKIAYMRSMFPKHKRNIIASKQRNVFEIATELYGKGFSSVVMVVGSDRVDEFQSLLTKYNDVEGRHGFYNFQSIQVVSAGERDPDAEGVTGMSASKMRAAASANDLEQFKLGLPSGFRDGEKLFSDVRKAMGIRESFLPASTEITDEDIFRDLYLKKEILNIGEEVIDSYTGVTGKIIRRGTNYVTFAEEDGTTHRRWLYELQLDKELDEKEDPDLKKKKGTQPAKYFAKDAEGDEMAKSTKDKRDAHFNKGKEKDDDDPSAYKPAPGDASAKTKPSKSTNKMKKKFPDLYKESQMIDEDADKSLAKKADASGISVSILKQVYKRGVAAWRTGHRPGTTPEQWGHARVNSFITGGKTRTTADADLWKQHKGKSEGYVIEARAKQAVAGGKVQKFITGFDMSWKGKKYNEIDFELVNIDNNTQVVTLKIIGPKEIFGGEVKIPFKTLRRGRFMATDTSKESVEDPREVGTDARREVTQEMTPGQEVEKYTVSEALTMVVKHGKKKYQLGYGQKIKMFGKEYSSVGVTKQQVYVVKGDDGERVFSKKEFEALLKKGDIEITDTGVIAQFERFSFKEHLNCGTPDCCNQCETSNLIESNIYRVGSEKYFEFFNEKRLQFEQGKLNLQGFDKELIEGDIGKFAMYEGEHVPLDCPMMESEYQGKDVELNKPKAGGPKKYYVYVKDGDKVKKVTWGDTTGLKVKLDDPAARKSFAARHDCENQKDKTKAGYWACNLPRYAKELGLSGGGNFFW